MEYEKLRNEFFEKHTVKDKDGIPKVHTHPHNLFEWFKKQLCEYNVSGQSEQLVAFLKWVGDGYDFENNAEEIVREYIDEGN